MSKNTTYEQIIAQKLEQLPVPDNSDAIWTAIEKQLDVVMPVNADKPSSAFKGAVKPSIIITSAVIVIIAALLIVYLFSNKNTPVQPQLKESIIVPPVEKNIDSIKTDTIQHVQQSDSKSEKNRVILKLADSVTSQIQVPVPTISVNDKKDSLQNKSLIIKTVPIDSISIPQKKRGVTGIGDDDYRFVPKDSTHN